MKTIEPLFLSKTRNNLVKFALLCSILTPAAVQPVYAAETVYAATSTTHLKVGDSHGGGVVAYIYRSEDQGYVAGETHGLIAAKNDQSEGTTWDQAQKICKEYRAGGFSDWRLPSKDELNKLYINRTAVGGFKERHFYWSSTASDKNDAWDQSFRTGNRNLGYKSDNNYVRAVRSF